MLDVPPDRLLDRALEGVLWLSSEPFDFGRINGVTQIVPGPIRDVMYQRLGLSELIQDGSHDVDVRLFVIAPRCTNVAYKSGHYRLRFQPKKFNDYRAWCW